MPGKTKHLAVYDYGSGGIWLQFLARSPREITEKYPELIVVSHHPSWLTGERLQVIEETFTFDIDELPKGWLKTLVRQRTKRSFMSYLRKWID